MKNVPPAERAARVLLSIAVIVGALVWLAGPWRPLVAASGAALSLTGFLGFCPACAMVGRKLAAKS